MTPKKILLLRFSSIGDIVLTTPVVRCIARQLPDAELHYATKPAFKELLASNPYVHKVHLLNKDLKSLIKELREEQFDFVVDLHNNQRTFLIRTLLGKPSGTFPKLNIAKWWLVHTKRNLLPQQHIVDRYFKAVVSLGIVNDGKGLDFFISPDAEEQVRNLFGNLLLPYTALVLGGTYTTKMIPENKLIELIPLLGKVVLVGGPKEAALGNRLSACFPDSVINTAGHLDMHGSAFILRDARTVITPDTGMMHIAAALKKPIVSVWGNTVPSFGMYPYRPDDANSFVVMEQTDLPCRPCSKLGYENCPKGHFHCMQLHRPDEIANAAELLAGKETVKND